MQLNSSHNIDTAEGFFFFHCCSLMQRFDCCEAALNTPRQADWRTLAAFRLPHHLQPVSLVDSDPSHLSDVTENGFIASRAVMTQQLGTAVLSWDDFLVFSDESYAVVPLPFPVQQRVGGTKLC